MAVQTAFVNALLEAAFGGGTYTGGTITMKLFTVGLPSIDGVEVTGGSYAAQTLTFSPAVNKVKSTSANAVFTDLPTVEIVAYGIYDGATLKDEELLSPAFTATVTNNTLELSYSFNAAGLA